MKIETKFDIGDKIWEVRRDLQHSMIDCDECGSSHQINHIGPWTIQGPTTVEGIQITINSTDDADMIYQVGGERLMRLARDEGLMFTTEEEAQAEADKRNAGPVG